MSQKSATAKAVKSVSTKSSTKTVGARSPTLAKIGGRDDADVKMRALSIRQPWVEEIMRGSKVIEYRSVNTNIRGTIYIYAGLGRYPKDEEASLVEDIGYDIDDLPRGFIVGTVDIVDCVQNQAEGDFEWSLANPKRLKIFLKPTSRPNPIWFFPFGNPADG